MRSARPYRIGLLVPSSNTVFENDLHAALPKSRFSVHAARMHLVETTPAAERRMIEEFAPRAAGELATLRPDLVVFGCTSAGSLLGMDYDRSVCEELGRRAGAPCIGVLSAVADAIGRRGWRRIAVVTPYIDALTRTIAASLRQSGFEVPVAAGMGIAVNIELADPTPEEIADFVQARIGAVVVDGVFVSCTNFRALAARQEITRRTGFDVVTSNLGAIEAVLARFNQEPPL